MNLANHRLRLYDLSYLSIADRLNGNDKEQGSDICTQAALSCSLTGPRLGGAGLGFWLMGKLGRAWVGAWVPGWLVW